MAISYEPSSIHEVLPLILEVEGEAPPPSQVDPRGWEVIAFKDGDRIVGALGKLENQFHLCVSKDYRNKWAKREFFRILKRWKEDCGGVLLCAPNRDNEQALRLCKRWTRLAEAGPFVIFGV